MTNVKPVIQSYTLHIEGRIEKERTETFPRPRKKKDKEIRWNLV